MMSGVTDCYQPAERRFKLTRGILEVLLEARQPVCMVTKNSLILRDLDVIAGAGGRESDQRRAEHYDARCGAGPDAGAANGDTGRPAAGGWRAIGRRRSGAGDARAAHSRADRSRDSGHS